MIGIEMTDYSNFYFCFQWNRDRESRVHVVCEGSHRTACVLKVLEFSVSRVICNLMYAIFFLRSYQDRNLNG